MLARRRPAEWSSFYLARELPPDVLRGLRGSQCVAGISTEGEFVRVRWLSPEYRRIAHSTDGYFSQHAPNVTHYEADVDPVRRFFSDTGAEVARPRRAYLDIETDSRVTPARARKGHARVLVWSICDEDERVVATGCLNAPPYLLEKDPSEQLVDEAERTLLEGMWAALEPFDQIVAWNGDGFDFPVVTLRTQILGVAPKDLTGRLLDLRRWLYMDLMAAFERMNAQTAESGDEKESLRLQDVCMVVLGVGKHDFDASKTYEAWAAGGAERQRLVDYCQQDVRLMPKLEKRKKFLALNESICDVGRVFADTLSLNPTTFVDGFLLRLAVERGTHFKSKRYWSKEEREQHEKFAGAYVMEPKVKGIAKDVHVCDFSGMYPSIILSLNASPETRRDVPVNGPIPPGHSRSPATGAGFANEPLGILCDALLKVRELRKYWTKRQAELPPGTPEWIAAGQLSTAYKVIANSFYGVVGSIFSRYFDLAVATSTTQTGVWLIQRTIHEALVRSIHTIYSDTDSAMVMGVAREVFAEFVAWCNRDLYPEIMAKQGCAKNYVEIAYEKEFERVVFVASKTYCGMRRHFKWKTNCVEGCDGAVSLKTWACEKCGRSFTRETLPAPRGEPEIKGLAYRRGDTGRMTRQLQVQVIDLLMKQRCEDPEQFRPIVERWRRRVLDEELVIEDVQVSKALSKSLREYTPRAKQDGTLGSEPAHVRVARILQKRGEQVGEGTKIAYYVVDGAASPQKVAPADDYEGDVDRHYLWEKLVWPHTERLLETAFPGVDWSGQYGKTRPSKRAQKAEAVGQQDIFVQQKAARARSPKATSVLSQQVSLFAVTPALGAAENEPYCITVEEPRGDLVQRLWMVVSKHAGHRQVVMRVKRDTGQWEDIPSPTLRVAVSPDFVAAIEKEKRKP